MVGWLILLRRFAVAAFKGRRNLVLENLALRHRFLVLNRNAHHPRLTPLARALWGWLSQTWCAGKTHLRIVQPDTVVRWHRDAFRWFWKWKSHPHRSGRKSIAADTINSICHTSAAMLCTSTSARALRLLGPPNNSGKPPLCLALEVPAP